MNHCEYLAALLRAHSWSGAVLADYERLVGRVWGAPVMVDPAEGYRVWDCAAGRQLTHAELRQLAERLAEHVSVQPTPQQGHVVLDTEYEAAQWDPRPRPLEQPPTPAPLEWTPELEDERTLQRLQRGPGEEDRFWRRMYPPY